MASDPVIGSAIPSEISAVYDIGETLGTGHFSKVKLGTHKETGEKVAIKVSLDGSTEARVIVGECS